MPGKINDIQFNKYSNKEFGLEFTFDSGECYELQLECGNPFQEVVMRLKIMAERLKCNNIG